MNYFKFALNDSVVSKDDVHAILYNMTESEIVSRFQYYNEYGLSFKLIKYLEAEMRTSKNGNISGTQAETLLWASVKCWNTLDLSDASWLFDRTLFSHLYFESLIGLIDKDDRNSILNAIILSTRVALETKILIVRMLEVQHGRFVKNQPYSIPQVEYDDVLSLEQIVLLDIKEAIANGTIILLSNYELMEYLLQRIDIGLYNQLLETESKSDRNIPYIVHHFAHISHQLAPETKILRTFNLKDIEKYFSLESVKKFLESYINSIDFYQLDQQMQYDLLAFLIFANKEDQEHARVTEEEIRDKMEQMSKDNMRHGLSRSIKSLRGDSPENFYV